jgi:hypothetical protein
MDNMDDLEGFAGWAMLAGIWAMLAGILVFMFFLFK